MSSIHSQRPHNTPGGDGSDDKLDQVAFRSPSGGHHSCDYQVTHEGFIVTSDVRLVDDFQNTIVKQESESLSDGGSKPVFTLSFGSSAPELADIDGVAREYRENSIFSPILEPFIEGLREFEKQLDRSWTVEQLKSLSPHLQQFDLNIHRDRLRFYFITSVMNDDSLKVTVFLEAVPEELLSRPRHYQNANKNLFTTYFSEDGVVRTEEEEFVRESNSTHSIENTAYAKFYIDTWDNPREGQALKEGDPLPVDGIDILIHPMQRARLVHTPARDRSYAGYRRQLKDLGGFYKKRSVALAHIPDPPPDRELKVLVRISEIFTLLSQHLDKSDFLTSAPEWRSELETLVKQLPRRPCYEVPAPLLAEHRPPSDVPVDEIRMRRALPFQKQVRSVIKHTVQVENIVRKGSAHTEAPYLSADKITGPNRELLFLAVSQLLKDCLAKATGLPVARFMLSSKQIEKMRLFRASDQIRERIKGVPLQLERTNPVVELDRHLFIVPREHGAPYPEHTTIVWLSVIGLDEPKEKANHKLRGYSPDVGTPLVESG